MIIRMDFELTEEQQLLRRAIREFAEAEIRPRALEWDEAQHFPAELVPALGGLGLMGIEVSEEYQGAGMTALDYCICVEELARVCPAVCPSRWRHTTACAWLTSPGSATTSSAVAFCPSSRGESDSARGP